MNVLKRFDDFAADCLLDVKHDCRRLVDQVASRERIGESDEQVSKQPKMLADGGFEGNVFCNPFLLRKRLLRSRRKVPVRIRLRVTRDPKSARERKPRQRLFTEDQKVQTELK